MWSWNRCVVNLPTRISLGSSSWSGHSCTKLFVGGLSYDGNESILKDVFGQHGEIIEVKVIRDHVCGKSRGYGFVQFTSESAASSALKHINGKLVDGRNIHVYHAKKS